MSVETSKWNEPGDSDSDDERTYGYRSADSAAAGDDVEDDDLDDDRDDVVASRDDVVSRDDEDGDEGDDGVVYGTVVEEDVVTDSAADPVTATDVEDPQPTFTPADDVVDDGTVDDTAVDSAVDANAPTLSETDDVPVVPAQADAPVTEVPVAAAVPADVPAVDLNGPLLVDSTGLRANWQQAQAGFVDDPRAAVAEAADLVEHTAQTLIGALQQRQQALRTQWDNNGTTDAAGTAGGASDTEQLRHLMQDYRNLFNQLCQP
jgi:hypothetical protein